MLILTDFLGKGSSRLCFKHPTEAKKVVKIPSRFKEADTFDREIRAFYAAQSVLNDFIARNAPRVVDTNLAKGLNAMRFSTTTDLCQKRWGIIQKTVGFVRNWRNSLIFSLII